MLNIKNDSEKLNYVGNFGTFLKEGETIKYSQNKGDYVELNFIGNKVRFYTHTNAWRGKANIYIDDIKTDTIDTYSQEEIMDVLVYESEELEYGEHKIKIEVLAENNTNPLVNIAWRSGEDIYNFYFNNCVLPANYVFCPVNKTNWIKQIIK